MLMDYPFGSPTLREAMAALKADLERHVPEWDMLPKVTSDKTVTLKLPAAAGYDVNAMPGYVWKMDYPYFHNPRSHSVITGLTESIEPGPLQWLDNRINEMRVQL